MSPYGVTMPQLINIHISQNWLEINFETKQSYG